MFKDQKIVILKDIVHVYRNPQSSVGISVLKGINLSIKKNEFMAITGPSGSGKSTLLRIISGSLKPTGGDYKLNGVDVYSLLNKVSADQIFENVVLVNQFAQDNLFMNLSVMENIKISMILKNEYFKGSDDKIDQLLSEVGLENKKYAIINKLSGGERQRINLICALASQPNLLIADEITGELDTETTANILALLKKFIRDHDITVILATHDNNAIKFVDRELILINGKLNNEVD